MKILTIVGARPQFVKAAVVSRAFKTDLRIQEMLLHTGQHYDKNMSDVFFEEMEIPTPDFNLNINGLSHGAMTGQMMEGIEKICIQEKPDFLMVYGDTNSTLAGALAAKKLHIKVIHIEAGLRSFDMKMPEEINRILTDRISDILFCPTETAIENLKNEGFESFQNTIVQNGDVMQDAAMHYAEKSTLKSTIIEKMKLSHNSFLLCTLHRQENTDDESRLISIISALNELNKSNQVIVPLHPRTKKIIGKLEIKTNFTITDPLGYFDMLELLKNCKMVITDSGGLQKESYFFSKFCITMRDSTEWTELIENGYSVLAGANEMAILEAYKLLENQEFQKKSELYGGGKAANVILKTMQNLIQ